MTEEVATPGRIARRRETQPDIKAMHAFPISARPVGVPTTISDGRSGDI
jgi:hypothetical protein